MTASIPTALLAYIADYINDELGRGAIIDKYTVTEAVLSFEAGTPIGAEEGDE